MLFLSEQDMKQSVTMKDVIDAIDDTYHVYESERFRRRSACMYRMAIIHCC